MSLLDSENEEKKPYTFASGSIDDFMAEMNRPKQAQDINETDGLDELETLQPETPDEPLEKLQATPAVALATASLLTIALDSSLSTVLGLYAGDEPDNYKADPEQRQELQAAIAEYVKLKGGDIPPGVALILIILSVYGTKGAQAFQYKKLRKEQEEKDRRIQQLEEELKKLHGKKKNPEPDPENEIDELLEK